jgi:hypothetical protein
LLCMYVFQQHPGNVNLISRVGRGEGMRNKVLCMQHMPRGNSAGHKAWHGGGQPGRAGPAE